MTPEELARGIGTLPESVQTALNKAKIAVGRDGHIVAFPAHGSPGYRVFMAILARQPDNEAQRLLRDVRNSGRLET